MERTTLAALLVLAATSSGLLHPSSCLTTGGLSGDSGAQSTPGHHQCTAGDLHRARQQVPRAPWKGPDFAGMSRVLTAKLTEAGHAVTPCEKWSIDELKDLQRTLFSAAEPELLEVYENTGDKRRHRRFRSLEALEAHWKALDSELEASAHREWLGAVRRDGLCHEAVMWFVHHLPEAKQRRLMTSDSSAAQHHNRTLPSLPETLHQGPPGGLEAASAVVMQPQSPSTHPRAAAASAAAAPESKVLAEYSQQVSCQQCHTGTVDDPKWQDAELPEPLPVDKVHPGRERVRSCDFQARPPCGPCEGLGGVRWGDGPEDMTPMRCEVVHYPNEAPPRTRGRYPDLGVASMSFETRSPVAVRPEGAAKYVKLRGTVTLGWNSDEGDDDEMMRMRYDLESSEGAALGAALYVQSAAQAREMDPGVTGSISPERCSCGRSIAGVMHTMSFDPEDPLDPLSLRPDQGGAAYLGRVRVELDGDTALGRRNATADHFMKWAFHFLVDADESSPTFGLPLRLYAPWGVRQVFESWTLGDPAERDPGVWKLPPGCERLAPGCSLFHEDNDDDTAEEKEQNEPLLSHPRASSASSGSIRPHTATE